MCADCHSTNLHKEFDFSTQTFATKYSEINVACESCHGPGRDHVEHAKSGKGWVGVADFALVDVNSTNVAQIESCAKCHARRSMVSPYHHAGNEFLDHFLPEVTQPWSPEMQAPTYHVDGQIDDEVYVYGSYIQSKMFHQGVNVPIVMMLIPPNCITTIISSVPAVMFRMIKILLGTIIPVIIFMKWALREPVAWSVTCLTKTTWLLMIVVITASVFRARIFL